MFTEPAGWYNPGRGSRRENHRIVVTAEKGRPMRNTVAFVFIAMTVVLVAAVCGARSQAQERSAQPQWEYRIVSYAYLSGIQSLENTLKKSQTLQELEALNDDIAHRMTDFGRQGWELVCVQERTGFIFKRKIEP